MGDIEAHADPGRPRRTVLQSVLPGREFATSRKGMLLIAEVIMEGTGKRLYGRLRQVILCCFDLCQPNIPDFTLNEQNKPTKSEGPGEESHSFTPQVLSFVSFVCFAASTAAAFVTVPLLEFLAALFLLFAYSTKFNERFKGFLWPLMDFMRCVTASIIFFIVSIIAVSKYVDGSSKAAGIFGFFATIAFALDFYLIFNELANFLKEGGEPNVEPTRQQDEFSDSDSD